MKGVSIARIIIMVPTIGAAILAIGIGVDVVGALTGQTGVSDDTNQLTELGGDIRSKCNAESGGSGTSIPIQNELEMSYAEELTKTSENLEMIFPEGQTRQSSLPDSCEVDFSPGTLEKGVYTLNISRDGTAGGNPKLKVETVS